MHKWYRDGQELPVGTAGDTYEILSAVQSGSGTYTCKGQHKERVLYTGSSNVVTLKVNGEAPKPLLTPDPTSGEIFTGDTVTLSCRVGTDPAGWEYLWYKETQGAALTSTDSSSTDESCYTIHSAAVSHGGEYWCRARRGKPALYTPYSDSLQLSITARPQAVLTLETAWTEIFRSDSLTLRCQVEGSSAEWNYTWYRDGRHLPLDPSGDRLTLSSGNDSYSSEYKCRGNRTGQPSYTEISEGFRANNIGLSGLKRKVLVSVASSVLLGLILTVLGCVCLRKKRKLAYKMTPQNDMFLSKPPTENLYGDDSNEEQSTEANAACSIELYSILDLKTKTEVLPPKQNPEDLTSFKAGQ
ncbi:hypothetical protein ANANG_G00242290 [Anguilla anguilla]|uniref:Ig-like domain-containing protein n=1 Tax=Anguilla anguilla TaxID=7936 RepID=A0A9D3RLR7_ANGAN|nr:hypothetical protein ANANG_G00242290 [Anguilla anguilla]